jgi:hypothetical protein
VVHSSGPQFLCACLPKRTGLCVLHTAGWLCQKKKNKSRKDAKTPRPLAANKQKQEARNKSREIDYNFIAPVRGGGQVSATLREEILLAPFQGGVSQMLPSILFMKLDFCFLLRVGIPLRLGVFARRKP